MSMTGDDRIHVTPTSAQKAFEQAAELHGDSQLAEAERLYDIALSLDPDHPGALCYLGLLRLQQDGPREAADLLRRATECDPGSPEAHNHLGTALQRLGNHVQALECHDRALTLLPEYSEARANRGRALQALGRVSESIPCYEAALADLPDSAPIQLALASALDGLDRTEAAFVHYRNAAALDPALAAPLSQALTAYSGRHPAAAQQGMQRLNQYIHSFLTNQGNARMGIYPGLSSTPFHDASRLPGAVALMQNHEAIAAEIEALAGAEFQPEAEGLMDRGAWDVFLFYERGRKNEENCARCPVITRIIESSNTVRTQAGLLYVSKLSPGTHIKPHRGPTNMRLRCHLGIRIPNGDCGLTVGGETRHWRQGECILFDDSLEHEAWNHTSEPRIVLIIDFWHPGLTPPEIAFLEGLHRFASFQAVSLNRYWAANAQAQAKARKHYD